MIELTLLQEERKGDRLKCGEIWLIFQCSSVIAKGQNLKCKEDNLETSKDMQPREVIISSGLGKED